MNKSQVRELIYKEVEKKIHDPTFCLKKSEEGFVRVIPAGKQVIGIPLVDYNPQFKFSLNTWIRIEAVESVVHRFLGSPPKYQKLSHTYCARLDYFVPDTHWFSVFTPDDISNAAGRLETIIAEKIIPFLDSHRDLPSVANAMNLTAVPDKIPGPGPAMYATTVARLTNNPQFEEIVTAYQQRVARLQPWMRDMFLNLVDYLRKEQPER
jgi:hypothetical protein